MSNLRKFRCDKVESLHFCSVKFGFKIGYLSYAKFVNLRLIYITFDQIYQPDFLASCLHLADFTKVCFKFYREIQSKRAPSKKANLSMLLHLRTKRAFYVKALASDFLYRLGSRLLGLGRPFWRIKTLLSFATRNRRPDKAPSR